MPIYEYKCLGCASQFEKMQKLSAAPLAICEKCGGKLEKQWSLSGFQFKGGGWYVTDYSDKGKSETKSADAEVSKSETPAATAAATPDDPGKKPGKAEKSEKTSAVESTAKSETASNIAKSDASTSKKE